MPHRTEWQRLEVSTPSLRIIVGHLLTFERNERCGFGQRCSRATTKSRICNDTCDEKDKAGKVVKAKENQPVHRLI